MLSSPHRPEIDHRTMKLIVGLIALSLANLTSFFASSRITSISASYYEGGWSTTIFVGFLFAIAAFLFAYNGYTKPQMVWSKIAAVAALCIALFPCGCDQHTELLPYVHGAAAAVMFGVLAFFCYVFYQRARDKGGPKANSRAVIYAISGLVIVASIATLAFDHIDHHIISAHVVRLTFYGEKACLLAFSASWLTASHCLPFLSGAKERPWATDQHATPPVLASA